MKITFVSVTENGFHVDQLKNEAAKRNIEFHITNFSSLEDFEEKLPQVGEVVIWRSSDLDIGVSRTIAMRLLRSRKLINLGVGDHPFVTNKIFQQKIIAQYLDYASIPTYNFANKTELKDAITNGILKFPFIQKPNLGARGVDVRLINAFEDLESNIKPIKAYVYQNFIPNNGDYRAFILGGTLLGIMKRVAKEGSILNNVSQGASAYVETDNTAIKNVRDIAVKVASLFDLQLCGVDVIFDSQAQKFKFLEVNTVPQWKGFTESTGINVAEKIIDYCIEISSKDSPYSKVKTYYEKNYDYLYAQKFHYASRLYLWSNKTEYIDQIQAFRVNNNLYDLDSGEIERRFQRSLFDDPTYKTDKVSKKTKYRRELRQKYPMMKKYSEVLTIYFFAKVIYNLDLSELVKKYISIADLQNLASQIFLDCEAIANGSTSCVNFLYFSKKFLNDQGLDIELDLNYFFDITKNYLVGEDESTLDKKLYLLTHTLIGESEFYSKKVVLDSKSEAILRYIEENLSQNFFLATLDMKLEFLVCCKMYGYETMLEPIIFNEAETSFGNLGNYLVDRCYHKPRSIGDNLYNAEHRSTLYLMAKTPRE